MAPLFCTVLHLDQCTGADIGVKIANVKTHTFNSPLSGTTRVSRYQKGKTNLDFTEARDSEWQWHQLGHMQVCTSLQTDNHTSTPPLSFLQAGCPSCHPTNSIKSTEGHCTFNEKHCRPFTVYKCENMVKIEIQPNVLVQSYTTYDSLSESPGTVW